MLNVDVILMDKRLDGLLAYGSEKAAGIDMRACTVISKSATTVLEGQPLTLYPGEQCKIGTGIKMDIGSVYGADEIPSLKEGLTAAGLLLPRSGLGTKYRIRLSNTVGLIDADYQGEIILVLENGGTEEWTIAPLERLAQLVLVPVFHVGFNVVEQFATATERGEGGFGSTGKH